MRQETGQSNGKGLETSAVADVSSGGRRRYKKLPHGTVSGYLYWGCRCEECRQACRDYYGRKSRAEHLAEITPPHGTPNRYWTGCRCDECRIAANKRRNERRWATIEHVRAYDRERKRRKRATEAAHTPPTPTPKAVASGSPAGGAAR